MIIEDYAAIAARCRALRIACALRQGINVSECWCFKQGPNGAHLPCPGAPIPPAVDPLEPVRARIRALFGGPFWQQAQ